MSCTQVYRTFVIWGRNFGIIAFPFLLFLADIGTRLPALGYATSDIPYRLVGVGNMVPHRGERRRRRPRRKRHASRQILLYHHPRPEFILHTWVALAPREDHRRLNDPAVMIAYKIWSVHRSVTGQAAGGVRITGIISVVLESGGSSYLFSCFGGLMWLLQLRSTPCC